jgi:hypothetical protein
MGGFQKLILFIAIIILLISLVVITISLYNSRNANWPPLVPSCPDYWISDGSGNNASCINVKDLGVCKPSSGDLHLKMNFNNAPYTGANGTCAKYTWANNCKVAWDGLNYGVNNPCGAGSSSSSGSTGSYGTSQSSITKFANWFKMPNVQTVFTIN